MKKVKTATVPLATDYLDKSHRKKQFVALLNLQIKKLKFNSKFNRNAKLEKFSNFFWPHLINFFLPVLYVNFVCCNST